jgi:hypothetical protein
VNHEERYNDISPTMIVICGSITYISLVPIVRYDSE